MSGNTSLHKAKDAKEDCFYTTMDSVEEEVRHYKKHFNGKTVLCNCDDPYESNFFRYFVLHFNQLKLKKLICTCYSGSPIMGEQISLFDVNKGDRKTPYKAEITKVYDITGDGAISMDDIKELFLQGENSLTELEGNGDFRSDECIEILKEADVVVTNPPFSLFREYLAQLMKYEKKFLIIGNQNAITYKEVFPLLKDNKMWLGYKSGDMAFRVPDYFEPRATRYWQDENGQKWRSMGNICWYTNLDIKKRHEEMILYRKYDPEVYPMYDNMKGCINIDKTADTPCDYTGLMGVPITFMDKYCPEQFEIIGLSRDMDMPGKEGMKAEFLDKYFAAGGTGQMQPGHPDLCYYDNNGKCVVPYRRVIIRNKHPQESEVK